MIADIAALSMQLSGVQLKQQVNTGLLKMAMDAEAQGAEKLIAEMQELFEELENLIPSDLGQSIDIVI